MDQGKEIPILTNFFKHCILKDKIKADKLDEMMLEMFVEFGYDKSNIENYAAHSYEDDLIIRQLYKSVFTSKIYEREDKDGNPIVYPMYENIDTVYKNINGVFLQIRGGKLINTSGFIVSSSSLVQGTISKDITNENITIVNNEATVLKPYIYAKSTDEIVNDIKFQTSILIDQDIPYLPGLSFFVPTPQDYSQYKTMIDGGDRIKLIEQIRSSYGRYRFFEDRIDEFSDDKIYNLIISGMQEFERIGIFNDPEEPEYVLDKASSMTYDVTIDPNTNEIIKNPVLNPNRKTNVKYIGEYNSYYRRLYKLYKIPIDKARSVPDFGIIKYELTEGIDKDTANMFIKIYNKCTKMFLARYHLYASRISDDSYFEFAAFMIFTMTVINFLKIRTEERFTIDGMYDRDIINKFVSYGIVGLENIPTAYKKLLLQDLPNFIRIKGSRDAIKHILSIFGVNNIDLVTYSLFKEYSKYDIYLDLPSYTEHMMIGDEVIMEYDKDDENDPDPTVYKTVNQSYMIRNDDEDLNDIIPNILEKTKHIYPTIFKIISVDDKLILSSSVDIDYTRFRMYILKKDSTRVDLKYIKDDIDSKSVDVSLYSTIDKSDDNFHDGLKKNKLERVNDGLSVVKNSDPSWRITKTELLENEQFSTLRTKHISIGNKINLVELSSKVSMIFFELKKIEPLINSYKTNLHFDTYENVYNDSTSLFNIIVGLLVMNLKRYGLSTKIPKDIMDVTDIKSLHLRTFRITDDIKGKFTDDKYNLIHELSDVREHNQYSASISSSINANLAVYNQYFTDEIPDYIRKLQFDPYLRVKYRDPGEVINDFKEGFKERFVSEETINLFHGYNSFDEYLTAESPYIIDIINRSIQDKKENDLFVYLAKVLSTQVSNQVNWVELDGKLLADYVTDIINTFRSYLIHIMNYDDKSITYSVGEYGINSVFLYDYIKLITGTVNTNEFIGFFDQLNSVSGTMSLYDSVMVEDEVIKIESRYSEKEGISLFTTVKFEPTTMEASDDLFVSDYFDKIESNISGTPEIATLFETFHIRKIHADSDEAKKLKKNKNGNNTKRKK